MSNIYEKLQSARVELQSLKLKKSGKNNYAGYDYYELSDFIPSVNKIFNNLKLFSNFSIFQDTATLTIIDSEDNTQNIVFTSPIAELELKSCNKVQALGGTHTYLKRYLYQNALEIVEDDMFDGVTGKENKKPEAVTQEDLDIIEGLKAMDTKENVKAYYDEYKGIVKNLVNFQNEYKKVYLDRKRKENK